MNREHEYFTGILNAFSGKTVQNAKVEAPNYPPFHNPQTGIMTVYVPCEWAELSFTHRPGEWVDVMPSEALVKSCTLEILSKYQDELEQMVRLAMTERA